MASQGTPSQAKAMLAPRKKLWSTPDAAIDLAIDLVQVGSLLLPRSCMGYRTLQREQGETIRTNPSHFLSFQVTEADVVYDIGSGDGNFLMRCAKATPARRIIGVEIDQERATQAQQGIEQALGGACPLPGMTATRVRRRLIYVAWRGA
jgi:hypothetical protein